MLSQALKNGVSSSSITSLTLASSSLSSPMLQDHCLECSLEEPHQLHVSVEDDADSPKFAKERASISGEDAEQEPFWSESHHGETSASDFSASDGIDALCRSFVASSLSHKCVVHPRATMAATDFERFQNVF